MIFDLTGRVVLVTGAGQGVGAGIAQTLAGQGAAVAVNDVVEERAEATAAAIRDSGGQAVAVAFDVTVLGSVEDGVATTAKELGPVDVLVNNAGNAGANTFSPRPFVETDPGEWAKFVDVNLYGVLHCTRAVLSGMCERQWGRVITISSGAGVVGLRMGISLYGAGKGGAISFMRHISQEVARQGVTANSVALGLMSNTEGSSVTASLARQVPVGRLGTPQDVGAACVWLASTEASWMTGQTINLNGGSTTT